MSKFNEYLEKVVAPNPNTPENTPLQDDANIEPGAYVMYNKKKHKVKSDEGDKLILNGVNGYVWKSDCQQYNESTPVDQEKEVKKVAAKEEKKLSDTVTKIIALIEKHDLQNDFDMFIGDEKEAADYMKRYKRNKYDAIMDFVKEYDATYDSVKNFIDEYLDDN